MRIFLTAATGFVGGVVARQLRERGDELVALVRSLERALALAALGCTLVEGDLESVDAALVDGSDAVVHTAAVYKVGIPAVEVESMRRANVDVAARVPDATLGLRRDEVPGAGSDDVGVRGSSRNVACVLQRRIARTPSKACARRSRSRIHR